MSCHHGRVRAPRVDRASRRPGRRAPVPPRPFPPAAIGRFLDPIGPKDPAATGGPRIVLLNDCRDQVNFGANALVDGLIRIIGNAVPAATIHPIPSHWLIDLSDVMDAFVNHGEGLRQPRARFPKVVDQFDEVADRWLAGQGGRDAHEFLTRLEGADLVVLNGEGSIYRTNQSAVRELFLAWLCKERLGIRTVFVNGSVHLTDVAPILPAMLRKTFAVLDAVAVREAWSLRNVREHAPDVTVRLYPDTAFVFDNTEAHPSEQIRSIRQTLGDTPYFCFDPGAMPVDDGVGERSAVRQLIEALKHHAPRAVLVASATADSYIAKIAAATGSAFVDTVTDYREFMSLIEGAQFLVSGRYHNIILAAIMGCPSIALGSTSHKVHGACEMLEGAVGMPYDGTDLRTQRVEIEDQAAGYVAARRDHHDRLKAVCARRRSEVVHLGDLVASMVRSPQGS